MNQQRSTVLFLVLAGLALTAAQWQGQLFNYQLQTVFNLQTDLIPGVVVYFIDLFDNDATTVAGLKALGLVPVCYFSTQYENWRPDANTFPADALGKNLDTWPGEKWVNIKDTRIRDIMKARIALCKQKGFLAIDPDNTDGYQAKGGTGFGTTKADTLDFLTFLSTEAKAQGLGIGLKNTLELIAGNVGLWDFFVNEQCYDWQECNYYTPAQAASKTVFNIQYTDNNGTFQNYICPVMAQYGIVSIRKAADQALNARPWDQCATYTPPMLTSPSPAPSSPSPTPASPSPTPPSPSPTPASPSPTPPSPSPSPKPPSPSPKPPSPSPTPPSPSPNPPSPSPTPPSPSPSPPPLSTYSGVNAPQGTPKGCAQGLAIPSYFYPGSLWTQAQAAKAGIVIINPASGPGLGVDQNYVNTVNSMKAAGATVLGYVYTQYGARNATLVAQDIDKYFAWYGVQGIFLDEGSNNCALVPYYDSLVAYIRAWSPKAVSVLNWGTDGPECFFTGSYPVDIVLNYENTYAEYLKWGGPSAWVKKYNATRFWHLVHSTPATPAAFWRAITLSKSRQAGWLYVTSDGLPNPWDTLPQGGLWDLLVSMLRSPQQVFVQGPYLTPCFTAASTCAWTRLKGSARIALANPNSGPGTAMDANWQRLINEAQTAGTLMLGYVATSTGTKALATVRSEINKYFQFYPNISGIFVDQVNTACTATPLVYYQNVTTHVRSLNSSAVVIFNWGSAGSECYLTSTPAPDMVGVFEGTVSAFKSFTPATWSAKYPAHRFVSTVYGASTTASTFTTTVTSTATKRVGYAYVTTGSSSLNALPSSALWTVETNTIGNATTVC